MLFDDECITAYGFLLSATQIECSDVTMQQYKDIVFPDGLVSGFISDAILVQLLESAESEVSLEKCVSHALAIKLSAHFSRSIKSSSGTSECTSNAPVGNSAPVIKRTAQPCKASNRKGFCFL